MFVLHLIILGTVAGLVTYRGAQDDGKKPSNSITQGLRTEQDAVAKNF